ncbi:MAG: SH3 domain-containing protein [Clostridia bacterium]|nr:SH3 domain-containing protein [Clostridia bacterium]
MVTLVSILATGVYADYTTGTYKITVDNGVNLRSGADSGSSKVGAIPYNKTVTVTEVKNGWGKTTFSGTTGWFSLEYAEKVTASGSGSTTEPSGDSTPDISGTPADSSKTYRTTAAVNLRKGPASSYDRYTVIPEGAKISISETKDGWGKTSYSGYTGWISLEYVKEYSTVSYGVGIYSIGYATQLYAEPSTSSEKLIKIPLDSEVHVTEISGGWGKTTYKDKTGWFNLSNAGTVTGDNSVLTGNQRIDIMNIAQAELGKTDGTKYTFGRGNVAWCAYFVSWAARQAGIPTSVIRNAGYARPWSHGVDYFLREKYLPSPGDLLYFDWAEYTGESNHVGIVKEVKDDGTIITIEGNSSNTVKNNTYRRNGSGQYTRVDSIYYYGVPDYDTNTIPVSDLKLKSAKDGKVTFCWTDTNGSYYDLYILPSSSQNRQSGAKNLDDSVARTRVESSTASLSDLADGSYVAVVYARPGSVSKTAVSNEVTFVLKNGTVEGANPTEPSKPETSEPEAPSTSEPEVPSTSEPEVPSTSEPEVPETSEPETSKPEDTKPSEPAEDLTGNYKTTAALNLRKSAGTSAARLLTIPKGKTIKVTQVKDNWGKTTYDGKTGWVSLDYAKKVASSTGSTGSTGSAGSTGTTETTTTTYTYKITTSSGVNLRKSASTSGAKLLTIPYHKTVTVTEVKNGWGKTTYGGKTGWFMLSYAKKTGTNTTTDTNSGSTGSTGSTGTTATTTTYTYKITTSSGVNLRKSASTSGAKLLTIPYNKKVTVTEVKNGWGKTTYGGKTGWFMLSYAKKTGTNTTTDTNSGSTGSGSTATTTSTKYKITASNGVNLRKGAGSSYDKVGVVAYNKTVTVTEVKNGWGKTTYGGKTGWFSLDYAKKS